MDKLIDWALGAIVVVGLSCAAAMIVSVTAIVVRVSFE